MKEKSLRPTTAIALCILFIGIFAYIATVISRDTMIGFDRPIIDFVQGWETPYLTPIMKGFSFIGSTKVVMFLIIAVTALLFWVFRARTSAYFFFFATVGTGALNQTLKHIFKRERPEFHRIAEAVGYSFPSGHTMMAFSLYAMAVILLWRQIRTTSGKIALLAFAIFMFGMIALSRIYLGVHYPSDIAGGIVVSAFWVVFTVFIFDNYQQRKKRGLVNS
ncbi:phosphatase PAP2 family protein [Sporosarcina highlanderae]|uniref:Phosphatase PAP2 family protein n=1 Tax=Sporosarcina highlanderae TaxID=3035916 RepID=A0ABT8JNV4_9BACL|nr:phosphatase PAP2 family protein [Sporosarcina highlanderae]MDN4606637.1 phosphatase PAP2 family protein [Sporosarcina highlanderae]